jgi:hypothetical protein
MPYDTAQLMRRIAEMEDALCAVEAAAALGGLTNAILARAIVARRGWVEC